MSTESEYMDAIYTTREDAIAALVEQDVARWGESERDESLALHSSKSFGIALTELAARAELAGDPNARALKRAAARVRDRADGAWLRRALD